MKFAKEIWSCRRALITFCFDLSKTKKLLHYVMMLLFKLTQAKRSNDNLPSISLLTRLFLLDKMPGLTYTQVSLMKFKTTISDVKNVSHYSTQKAVLQKFLVFSKTHVRLKISISHLRLPQSLIVTYQSLS